MIVKSNSQLEKIKIAGYINAFTLEILKKLTLENYEKISANTLDEIAYKIIITLGGKPSFKNYKPPFSHLAYPYSITVSINEEIVHGLPLKTKTFKENDIISIDCGTYYQGYHVDSAISFSINGKKHKILEVCENSLYLAIEKTKHGVPINEVGKTVENYVTSNGFKVIKQLTGHGVGRSIHDEPEIPNFFIPAYNKKFFNNMLVAIEPMISESTEEIEVLEDQWTIVTKDRSLSAHFEHTVLIQKDNCQIVTQIPQEIFNDFFQKTKHIITDFIKNL
ncbi:MAG: type I methionyl aminopeptidase [bacterium]